MARITQTVDGRVRGCLHEQLRLPGPRQRLLLLVVRVGATAAGSISINFSHYGDPKIDTDLTTGRQSGYPNDPEAAAYDDLVKQLNASATHIWLYYTPFTYIAQKRVQGLDTTVGPGHVPFGNFTPKTWWSQIWLSH